MRAVAASRKLGARRDQSSNADKSGSSNNSSHAGARQKIANQRSSQQARGKQTGHASTSFYSAVPTASLDASPASPTNPGDKSVSIVPSKSRGSLAKNASQPDKTDTGNVSPSTQRRAGTPVSSRSLDFAENTMNSPGSMNSNGPKKNIKDLMPRNVSNLSHGASSVATTNAGATNKIESRLDARRRAREKRYYAKAIALMAFGGTVLVLGLVFAGLYFAGWDAMLMAGPIAVAMGLLLTVCGIVWVSIIKAKLKRRRQIMSRTFSL